MNIESALMIGLAGWRLAFFITREEGPWRIAERLRNRFPLGGATSCVYCASFWTTLLMAALWLNGLSFVVLVFAASAAGLMLAVYSGAQR